jgi:hypothetical protein
MGRYSELPVVPTAGSAAGRCHCPAPWEARRGRTPTTPRPRRAGSEARRAASVPSMNSMNGSGSLLPARSTPVKNLSAMLLLRVAVEVITCLFLLVGGQSKKWGTSMAPPWASNSSRTALRSFASQSQSSAVSATPRHHRWLPLRPPVRPLLRQSRGYAGRRRSARSRSAGGFRESGS